MDYPVLIVVLVAFVCLLVMMLVDIYRSHVEVSKTHKDIIKILDSMVKRQEKDDE